MTNFWKFFIDNRAFTYFLVFLALLSGVYAITSIPKESTPEITIPIAVVSTPFFGATATDVETLVTDKIEKAVSNLSGVDEYTSTSNAGFSTVVVNFNQSEDIDERVTRLKEQIDLVKGELPSDGNDPSVSKVEFSSQPVFTVSLVSDLPFYTFEQVVLELEDELLDIDQVAEVSYTGIPDREITVVVDNRRLIQTGLDFNTVLQALQGANVTLPVGSLLIGDTEYPLDLRSEVKTFEQLSVTPIAPAGQGTLQVGDVAELFNGYRAQTTRTEVGIPGSEPQNAVTINISKKNGGDITRLTADIENLLVEKENSLLQGIEYIVTFNAGADIQDELLGLTRNGLTTVVLVFLVLLLFVGFRESIIAAASIPLSFMIAFVAFLVVGNTINFISLFALILSIGILVDSAIVIVEGINGKVSQGMTRVDAAVATIREFGIPLFAGTMTTVAIFFPLLFLSGIIGQFISGIPYTVIFVLLASIFVSLGFVTVFCASFLKNRDTVRHEKKSYLNGLFDRAAVRFKNLIRYFIDNPASRRLFQSLMILAVFVSIALVVLGLIKVEFFPGGDIEFAYVRVERDPGTSLEETALYIKEIEKLIADTEYVESYVSTAGRASQYEEEVITGDQYGNIILNIKSEFQGEGVSLTDPLRIAIASQFSDAELVAGGGGPPTGAAVDISFSSDNAEDLRAAVREAELILADIQGITNITSSLAGNSSGFDIFVDRNAAYRFGVQVSSVAQVIRGATDGIEIFTITENGNDVPVFVRNRLNFNSDETIVTKDLTPDQLLGLSVKNNQGEDILLGSLISIQLAESDVEISRKDGERVIGVTGDVAEGFNANEVNAVFRERLAETDFGSAEYSFGGEQAEQNESFAEVGIAFLAGIFLMFSILILQFGRWRQVLIIMSVVPFALAGVLLGLFISGNSFSFPAILGLIALSGIVVNNSIILVSVFNDMRRDNPDMSIEEVVIEGSASRLRAIVLTTITTIIGVSPLLVASAIWAPIAYAIIFGLSFCVLVTLIIVPLLYRRLEMFRNQGWRNVRGWWLTVLLGILLPLIFVGLVLTVVNMVQASTALALIVALVVGGIILYIASNALAHRTH